MRTIRPQAMVVWVGGTTLALLMACFFNVAGLQHPAAADQEPLARSKPQSFDTLIARNAANQLTTGRDVFRFATFGDEDFWGGQLKLHQAVATLSPRAALGLGLKVDADAVSGVTLRQIREGRGLDDPRVTLDLLRRNAVVGVTGFFDPQHKQLTSIGIQCSLCHSTVDDSTSFGVGHRLDGWANRDLDVGKVIASAPDLTVFANLLGVSQDTVRQVLNSWGPGKFDAELLLDGKAFRPDGKPAATLIPNAYGLAGYNQVTWTGGWGTVTYWNALVANLEMRGKGVFFDPRLDDATKFPIAAAHRDLYGHVTRDPDDDQITSKLPSLQVYQLAIPAPVPRTGVDFNLAAAKRGDVLFSGKAKCNNCHREPLWTEPGWNVHKPEDIGIDSFQAERSPDGTYKTSNLAGLFVRENGLHMRPENKGRFFHDGRFKTLLDVVNHYDGFFGLGLTAQEKSDLVEYLKSLTDNGSAIPE